VGSCLCLELSLELSSYWASAFSLRTPWKPKIVIDSGEVGRRLAVVFFSVSEDPDPASRQRENGAVASAVPVHLRVEPAHFDWRWRERPVLALLAWEALARDPLARLRRIQVESIGTTINFRPAAIINRDIAVSAAHRCR
jgi:hypothetical protein